MFIGLPALGLLALAYLMQAFRVGVRIERGPSTVNVGTDGVFFLRVSNRLPWETQARLRIRGLPPGWTAATSFPMIQLDARDTASVPLLVRVPVAALPDRTYKFEVHVRPNGWTPWVVRRTVSVSAVDVVILNPLPVTAPAAGAPPVVLAA